MPSIEFWLTGSKHLIHLLHQLPPTYNLSFCQKNVCELGTQHGGFRCVCVYMLLPEQQVGKHQQCSNTKPFGDRPCIQLYRFSST